MKVKIIKRTDKVFCVFCRRKLTGNIFLDIESPFKNISAEDSYTLHISCGYHFLKSFKKMNRQEYKIMTLLETKYAKELAIDMLK